MRGAWAMPLFALGCVVANPSRDLPPLDRVYFDRAVQPVLARNCAFPDCHGTPRRFLRIYARDRHRVTLGDGTAVGISNDLTRLELDLNYERVLGFVNEEEPEESLLVRKPLAEEAGGLYHAAADLYRSGLDVFLDTTDPDYQTLVRWVFGGAPCEDVGSESSCEVPRTMVPE